MDDPLMKPELDQLLARVVDETATSEDLASLETLLDGDANAVARYIRYLDLHHELQRRGERASTTEQSVFNVGLQSRAFAFSRFALTASLASALLLGVGMAIGHWLHRRTVPVVADASDVQVIESTDDGVAVLVHAIDVVWQGKGELSSGSILSPGELSLERGLAEIEFYSGARVIVEGPANLEVVSANQAVCRSGKVRAFVPPQARGFSIVAPQFELVDLGTEFGLQVAADGQSNVQVFDGEVELYPPDGKREQQRVQRLLGGSGMVWDANGKASAGETDAGAYPSFEDVRTRSTSAEQKRFANWRRWSEQVKQDSRVLAHYDFEGDGTDLFDRGPHAFDGTIVGCGWASGRWSNKRALEFRRPGDRVRVNVPGDFESLTMMAWIRVDALPNRRQSLLLTDRYEIGHVHWQLGRRGELRLGTRVADDADGSNGGSGYGSKPMFGPRRVGTWSFVCSVYDGQAGEVRHYLDGKERSVHPIVAEQKLKIGLGDIGNWSVPVSGRDSPIRNFSGRIDELTIWSAALPADEIQKTFRNGKP